MNTTTQTQPTAGAMRALHTPTPWIASRHRNPDCLWIESAPFRFESGDELRRVVATVRNVSPYGGKDGEPEMRANQELIVRAVNGHAELVEALNSILVDTEPGKHPAHNARDRAYATARAVLARHAGAGRGEL